MVSEFDANGHFLREVAAGGALDAPWGITMAPAGFGKFGGDLLVGNLAEMVKSTPSTLGPARFSEHLEDGSGNPLVNDGLWSLSFRSASGVQSGFALLHGGDQRPEKDGLFGAITPTPEPATFFDGRAGLGCDLRSQGEPRKSPASATRGTKRS